MKKWIEENQHKLWFAVLLNVIILATLMLMYKPLYEKNDDMAIISLVSGMKGVFDEHLIYINRVIGYLLKFLYQMNPNIIWYALLQYGLLFLAFTGVTYVFLNKFRNSAYLPIVILFLYFFGYEGYIRIQFTKTAGILSVAGGILLFYALFQKKLHKPTYVCGCLIAMFGSFYRAEQFLCEIALLTGFGVLMLLSLKEFDKGKRLKRLCACVITFAVLLGLGYGIYKVDRVLYDTTPEWEYYMDYTKARADLLDHAFPDYEENETAYKAAGIDEITFKLFKNWTHQDPEKIDVEVMESIISLKKQKSINAEFFRKFAKTMGEGVWTIKVFGFCLLLGFLWLLKGNRSPMAILTLIYEAGAVVAIYLYLFYVDRYLHNRVDVGIWMVVAVLLMWLLDNKKSKLSGKLTLLIMMAVMLVTTYRWSGALRINQKDLEESFRIEREVWEEMNADDEHLYLTKTFTVSFANAYGVFESVPVGIGDNMYPLGGWTAQTKPYMDILDKYEVTNPFRDMVNNDKVYIIDQSIDTTIEYIRTWYDENAEAVLVKKLGKHSVYKVVSE